VSHGERVQVVLSDDYLWDRDYAKWRRACLRRVQDSARVWLGVLTTLHGLLGSVVLFKGGSLVTGVTSNGWWQTVLILLVGIVFATAVLAVVVGGVATWGGLKDIPPEEGSQPPSSEKNGGKLRHKNRGKWGRRLFTVILMVAWISREDRETALKVFEGEPAGSVQRPGDYSSKDQDDPWKKYRDDIVDNADRNRLYLHASRVLGVFAAVFIAVLAIVAVVAGTVAPAPSDVIVVQHGRLICGPVGDTTKYTDVTHVVPVTSC
jgi:membrane protein YqaA with SNARE-associated domain